LKGLKSGREGRKRAQSRKKAEKKYSRSLYILKKEKFKGEGLTDSLLSNQFERRTVLNVLYVGGHLPITNSQFYLGRGGGAENRPIIEPPVQSIDSPKKDGVIITILILTR